MPIIASTDVMDDPNREERLATERACRAYIKRIFDAVLADRWSAAFGAYRESRSEGEWFHVAVWAGLPNTVKERLREMDESK